MDLGFAFAPVVPVLGLSVDRGLVCSFSKHSGKGICVRRPSPKPASFSCCSSQDAHVVGRRSVLAGLVATAGVLGLGPHTDAAVNFDIDRYGDKELKVSTINSVKQNCRNILQQRPDLLPSFFMLGVHDALTYNVESTDGGPNGSLRFELDREESAFLKEAVEELTAARQVRKDISFADTYALAGAVAMEITSGPRIIIQLGRDDATEADPAGGASLYRPGASANELASAFNQSGLNGPRDVVLIHGAEGSLADIAKSRVEKMAKEAAALADEFDEEDELDGALEDVTYGRISTKKRGPVLVSSNVSTLTLGGAKFSNSYLKYLVDAKKKGNLGSLSERDRSLIASPTMMPFIEQYAGNNSKFREDCANLFQRMTLLGSSYESLRLQDKI